MIPEEETGLLAAEYALGLLEGADLATAAARVDTDPAFAAEVDAWGERLMPMIDGPDAIPPAAIWARIQQRLPANDDQAAGRYQTALRRWKAIAGLATAAAVALLLMLLVRPDTVPAPAPPTSDLVAALGATAEPSRLAISIDPGGRTLLVTPVGLTTETRVAELWVIPADGKPRSLGVIDSRRPRRVQIAGPNLPHIRAGSTLAVTLEPPGGSPTGGPTGPIVASGKIIIV